MPSVPLATFYELALPEIMRGALEAEGIPAFTTGGATASLYGGVTGVTLWVDEDDERAARRLLDLPAE